jgi:hypothetical protein
MALQTPFSVNIHERGDPAWLFPLKLAIATIVTSAVLIVLTRVVKRRIRKDATEIQLTGAALAITASFSAVLFCL